MRRGGGATGAGVRPRCVAGDSAAIAGTGDAEASVSGAGAAAAVISAAGGSWTARHRRRHVSGCNRRLCCRFLNGPRLFFTGSRHGRRLDHHAGRRAPPRQRGERRQRACGRLGDDRACRRPRSNGRSRRRRSDNGRRRPRLRNNLARFWTCRRRCGLHWCCRRDGCRACTAARLVWLAERLQALPADADGAPLLPLLASWPEWPSTHRRAWRCATGRSSGQWFVPRGARCRTPVRSRSRILR